MWQLSLIAVSEAVVWYFWLITYWPSMFHDVAHDEKQKEVSRALLPNKKHFVRVYVVH
ncbi:hypothetical protein EJ02DRAFT_457448 [Clathrospora elynae]|uniref:Uncharacterized protein n=1 Tax=Clathrospora elynae TaxID=706981 RepID=A0A6A5SGG5_9PLEO|nr:hypothetical protein EJ02DRAFT_457448 [Clathrospora elynae]